MFHSPTRYYRSGLLLPSVLLLLMMYLPAPADHFTLEQGDLPVLLVAPHGGNEVLPRAPARLEEESQDPHFSTSRDMLTSELARLYGEEFKRVTGKKPSLLLSSIHRKYCDLNRPREWAAHSEAGRAYHQAFHSTLREELDRMTEEHGWALLMDIHGQSSEPHDLMIGVRLGKVIGPWSRKLLWEKNGVVDRLRAAGFSVVPDRPDQKMRYGGGFIVKNYGSVDSVEAWQFEHGKQLRFDPQESRALASLIAEVVARALASRKG